MLTICRTLRHVAQYSPLLTDHVKKTIASSPAQPSIKDRFSRAELPLSELPYFLNGTYKLEIPVYTVWGACEDVQVLEKLRSGEYKVDNLHIIDEAHSKLLDVGGVKLRLLGLGGAVVMHKLFDNGEGRTTIAGGQGTMWTTLLQMGELVDTANRVYDPTETRIFVTHASPAREGLLNQLSVTLKSDFSISAGLHFRYGSSYNEFSVNPTLDHYRGKLAASKASFDDVWQTVKGEVEPAVKENEHQERLLNYALELVNKMPTVANGGNPFGGQVGAPGSGQIDESAFKNMWNFNLADAAYGWLVLDIDGGRIGTEMRAQGFNFAHRGGKVNPQAQQAAPAAPSTSTAPVAAPNQQTQPPQSRPPPPQAQQAPRQASTATPPAQAQANRAPGPQPARSPQPIPQTASQAKPATPQPSSTASASAPATQAAAEKSISTDAKTNGTTPTPKPETPKTEPKQESSAFFVRNTKDEEETRNLVPEDDRDKIEKVEKSGQYFIIHFKTPEEMKAVLGRVPQEYKARMPDGKPHVAVYNPRGRGGSNWHGSTRGGAPHQAGGYRSGGASDSEGGRGGFRGGRGGRSERGSDRGRGGRGRGGFNKEGGSGSPASATAAAAPAATGGGESKE